MILSHLDNFKNICNFQNLNEINLKKNNVKYFKVQGYGYDNNNFEMMKSVLNILDSLKNYKSDNQKEYVNNIRKKLNEGQFANNSQHDA